jgi:hypothetical protein
LLAIVPTGAVSRRRAAIAAALQVCQFPVVARFIYPAPASFSTGKHLVVFIIHPVIVKFINRLFMLAVWLTAVACTVTWNRNGLPPYGFSTSDVLATGSPFLPFPESVRQILLITFL